MTTLKAWATVIALLCVGLISLMPAQASGTYYRPGALAGGRYSSLPQGKTRVSLRMDTQHYGQVRMFNGTQMTVGDVRLRTYTLTGEYGLTDRASAYVSIPFVDNDSATNAPPFTRESGVGDLKIGANQVLKEDASSNTTTIGTLEVAIPLRNYSTFKLTAPGDNSVDFTGLLTLRGNSIGHTPLFYSLGAGLRLRASQSPSQLLWNAELGGRIGSVASVAAFIDSINSLGGEGLGAPGFNGNFKRLKVTTTRLGARLNFNIGNIDGELYYAKAIVYQNQAPFDYLGLSVAGRF